MTTIAESRDVHKKMKLPAITLCPGLAYKNQSGGPYLKEAEFERNAFNMSDLFKETWFFQNVRTRFKKQRFRTDFKIPLMENAAKQAYRHKTNREE